MKKMLVVNVETWEECQSKFNELEQYRSKLKSQKAPSIYISPILFRGQPNAEWKLTTTLERYGRDNMFFSDYYRIISIAKTQIESFTGKLWEIPSYSEPDDFSIITKLQAYEYMIYLRHHGFPSPLLDWTKSPFIAAYFAFHNIPDKIPKVSIYAFIEDAGEGKMHMGGTPRITSRGPNVKTHPRHFLQQCWYTTCTMQDDDHRHFFVFHEAMCSENSEEQDLLWKINITSTERLKVLAYLDSININAFSLFGSEESLMETLALREFYLRKYEN